MRDPRKDTIYRPGHRESRDSRDSKESRHERDESRDRRDYLRSRRGRDRYESRHEEQFSDESSGRDNRRGDGRRGYEKSYGYRRS